MIRAQWGRSLQPHTPIKSCMCTMTSTLPFVARYFVGNLYCRKLNYLSLLRMRVEVTVDQSGYEKVTCRHGGIKFDSEIEQLRL